MLNYLENYKDADEYKGQIKGLEAEIKPMLPKATKDRGKILLDGSFIKGFKRKYNEHKEHR